MNAIRSNPPISGHFNVNFKSNNCNQYLSKIPSIKSQSRQIISRKKKAHTYKMTQVVEFEVPFEVPAKAIYDVLTDTM